MTPMFRLLVATGFPLAPAFLLTADHYHSEHKKVSKIMAQAEDQSAPRKTTTYKKFSGMASQNERYNVKDDEFPWLENIMRTGPRKLKSVPGPGPAFMIQSPPTLCIPKQQGLVQTDTYEMDQNNARASWGFINPADFQSAIVETANFGTPGGGGWNTPFPYHVFQRGIHSSTTQVPTPMGNADLTAPAGGFAPPVQGAQFAKMLMPKSDVPAVAFVADANLHRRFFFIDYSTGLICECNNPGHPPLPAAASFSQAGAVAKSGSDVWWVIDQGSAISANVGQILQYSFPSGAFVRLSNSISTDAGYFNCVALQATSQFLYAMTDLVGGAFGAGDYKIVKLDRATLNVVNVTDTGLDRIVSMFVVDDTFIYFARLGSTAGDPLDIYFWHNNAITKLTSSPVVISNGSPPYGVNLSTVWNFWFSNPNFYIGMNGFAGFDIDIAVIGPLVCP